MATTPNVGIVYPVVGNTITPLATHFANLATSTDTAIVANASGLIGTDAQRIALTGAVKREGLEWYSTDTNKRWFYDGTNWLSNSPGSYLVEPTTVANGTINSDGSVSFTAVASVSLNGVFTTRFREYEVSWEGTRSGGIEYMRLRGGGSDNTAASYGQRRVWTTGSGYNEAATIVSQFDTSASSFTSSYKTLRVLNPATAAFTRVISVQGGETDGASLGNVISYFGEHRVSAAYDGMSLVMSAGTISGRLRVIGFA